jgi:peptidoglycan hydrolase-like protein with peptidoglycan-binding domain
MGRPLTIATALVAALVLSSGVGIASASPLPRDLPLVYGDRGDTVHKAHYRLNWLGYDLRTKEVGNDFFGRSTMAAVKGFQRKFFLPINGKLNKDTWKMLDKVGDDVGKLPKACLQERQVLCIDKTSKLLRYVLKGKVVQTLDVRFGVPGLDTPTGTYRVYYKDRYATSGIGGPDVPRAPMPYALFFNGDIAVHYSPTFAASGYYPGGGSHGCVNVADLKGVSWLFDQIPVGTRVHVYWS